ncbi:MAG: WbqC family protein [Planctomycetota bacterium]|nr:WbqC family protein [Planctomycetota bacterium]MDI6786804.1 WbqC family protein [Planctomycetota bacterium]
MLIAGHQPNYLPYPGFFHKASLADTFVIVDVVQYVKRGPFGWINRNRIRTSQGWLWLTVPVKTRGRFHQSIMETEIDNSTDWAKKHLRSIERNYSQAPYFHKYIDFFRQTYQKEWAWLVELNESIIRYLIESLGIKVKIIKASQLQLDYNQSQSRILSGTDLIIEICQKLNCRSYLHGKHSVDYLDNDKLRQHNIKSFIQGFKHPIYKQVYEPFIPEMSVIDLLFNCGEKSLEIIKSCCSGMGYREI